MGEIWCSLHVRRSKLHGATAKPSVMVDGTIVFGCGRFISALLRGDQQMMVWDVLTSLASLPDVPLIQVQPPSAFEGSPGGAGVVS